MHERRRHEIFQLESDELLYRMYFFDNGEISFTVTGDNIRLGLLTPEDRYWDCSFDLPRIQETSTLVQVHSHPLKVLRALALRLAQSLVKHRPPSFYYPVTDDARRHRVYERLLRRHAQVTRLYDRLADDTGRHVMFTLR